MKLQRTNMILVISIAIILAAFLPDIKGFLGLDALVDYSPEPVVLITVTPSGVVNDVSTPSGVVNDVSTSKPWSSYVEVGVKYRCDVTKFVEYDTPIEIDGINFENTVENEVFVSTHMDDNLVSSLQIRTSRDGEFLRGIAFIQRGDGYKWVGVSNPESNEIEGPWQDVQTAFITLRFVNTTEPIVAIYYLPWGLEYDKVLWNIIPESEFDETCD